jgi:hypothetical protein
VHPLKFSKRLPPSRPLEWQDQTNISEALDVVAVELKVPLEEGEAETRVEKDVIDADG